MAKNKIILHDNKIIFIFRGLVLQDLTFIHIGNPDFLSDDIVNFSKRCQQFNILHNMQKFNKWLVIINNH